MFVDDVGTVDAELLAVDVVAEVVAVLVVVDPVVAEEVLLLLLLGATTYDVPRPYRCPQYLLSSISSSKNISFMRKNV